MGLGCFSGSLDWRPSDHMAPSLLRGHDSGDLQRAKIGGEWQGTSLLLGQCLRRKLAKLVAVMV